MSNRSSTVSLALPPTHFAGANLPGGSLAGANFTGANLTGGQSSIFFQAIFESMMQGVLILNDQREIIQANRRGQELCKLLGGMGNGMDSNSTRQRNKSQNSTVQNSAASNDSIPEAIWNVCRALLSSRQEFPEYQVIPEEELEMSDATHLKIYAQWLDWSESDTSYMLVTLEDRSEMLRNLARWDARRYDLTAREAEVWMLRCQEYSYDEIADELYISRNTVKKHLKSINFKRESSIL